MSKKMTYKTFLDLAKEIHGEKYIYNDETEKHFNGSHSKIPIICPEHGEFWIEARNHLKHECWECSYEKRALLFLSNTNEFIKKARLVHGNKYDYSKVVYRGAHVKVCIICPIHGEFWQTPNDHLNGKGCKKCKDSHLEKVLGIFLDKNDIVYEKYKHFEWLGRLEFDFYLPKYNLAIECQGKQHFGLGGWSKEYNHQQQYDFDFKKQNLSKENGVTLLYYVDKSLINKAFQLDLYNKDNLFHDKEKLLEEIKKRDSN